MLGVEKQGMGSRSNIQSSSPQERHHTFQHRYRRIRGKIERNALSKEKKTPTRIEREKKSACVPGPVGRIGKKKRSEVVGGNSLCSLLGSMPPDFTSSERERDLDKEISSSFSFSYSRISPNARE